MKDSTFWRNGIPPSTGWWNVCISNKEIGKYWGWWNGKFWSSFALCSDTDENAAKMAKLRGWAGIREVHWNDFWPANARVDRKGEKQ